MVATTDAMLRRLVWFAILWAGGVAVVTAVAFVIKLFLAQPDSRIGAGISATAGSGYHW